MTRKRLAIWICAALLWLCAAALALVHQEQLSKTLAGQAIGLALLFPPAFALYLLAHAVGEAIVLGVLLTTFKVVTLNRIETEYTNEGLVFPWHGFTRKKNGALVASENAVALIAVTACAVIGALAYVSLS